MRKSPNHSGISILELAIVIPFVLFFGLNCIEFSRAFRYYLKLTAFAREAGISAFRECTRTLDDTTDGNQQAATCFQKVLNSIGPTADVAIYGANSPGTDLKINLSAYKWRGSAAGSAPMYMYKAAHAERNSSESDSRYRVQDFGSDSVVPPDAGTTARMLYDHNVLVFVEVSFPYSPLFPIVPGGVTYFIGGNAFYVSFVL